MQQTLSKSEAARQAQIVTDFFFWPWDVLEKIKNMSSDDIDAIERETNPQLPYPEYISENKRDEISKDILSNLDEMANNMPIPMITEDNDFDLNILYNKEPKPIVDLLFRYFSISSKKEAKKLIQWGGIYVNEQKIEDITHTVSSSDAINGVILLRKGKKGYRVVRVG